MKRVLLVALLAACGSEEEAQRRSAVLITLDTTNPAATDLYGKQRDVSPSLLKLAGDGVVYDRAWTVTPITLPSHSSMLTGLYPARHGVRDNGWLPLPGSADTVAEAASAAGVDTAAFVAAVVLAAPYGTAQGFDVYESPSALDNQADLGYVPELPAETITGSAMRWLTERDSESPFFLWVHYFDPHAPYEPSAADEQATGDKYLGEIRSMDRSVGKLLDHLSERPDYDDLAIVVVADHGEARGRHGEPTHSALIYDDTMRVPMLVRFPGGEGGGTRSDRLVSVVDVAPTLLEAMGLEVPLSDGESLFAESRRDTVVLESYCGFMNYGWCPLTAVVQGDAKYIHGTNPELYDLSADPKELRNLYQPGDPRVARALAYLEGLSDAAPLPRDASDKVEGHVDVTALGYAGAASEDIELPGILEETGLPDPRSRMGELDRVYSATLAHHAGRTTPAVETLKAVLDENPGNHFAAISLSSILVDARRFQEAIEPLEGLIAAGVHRSNVYHPLARAYHETGDPDRARAVVEAGLLVLPGDEMLEALRDEIVE